MNVVFITHNALGLACLEELHDIGASIEAVYTRPQHDDIADQTNLKSFTDPRDVPLHRVKSVNTDCVKRQLKGYAPDLLFVVGWSRLVDQDVLDVPSVAALGMHPAPLPRGRGRAPLAWSLIKGLDETALSFFHLVEEADAGDLVGQEALPITDHDDAASLYEKVIEAGRTLVRRHYPTFEIGEVPRIPQDDNQATWWPKREPHHGLVDWTLSPGEVYDWIRGQTRPYPGAFSYVDGEKVTIWGANQPSGDRAFALPGEILYRNGKAIGVGAWEGCVEITEIELSEGPVPANDLLTEYGYSVGDEFEAARDCLQ